MTATTRWVKFRTWSGVSLHGKAAFTPDAVINEWDVVFQAVTVPEGGAYDTFVSYDGTGITWGFSQWTATSGRLQRLLKLLDDHYLYEDGPADLALEELGLDFDPDRVAFTQNDKVIRSKADLREWLTTPVGQVPRTGKLRTRADVLADGFWRAGQNAEVAHLQEQFFQGELVHEAMLKRPKMRGLTIKFYLYPGEDVPAFGTPVKDPYLTAARALFWSFWQNSPRKAEEYLHKCFNRLSWIGPGDLYALAGAFAKSGFSFWGNAKCKRLGRESRYSKVAKAINALIGDKLKPPLDPSMK